MVQNRKFIQIFWMIITKASLFYECLDYRKYLLEGCKYLNLGDSR